VVSARILDIAPDEYFALDSHFSSSAAKALLARSPLHARADIKKKPTKLMDRGNIIHRLVLGKGKDYLVVQHSDWRTKDAQKQRDEAYDNGLVPVLAHTFEEYCIAAEAIRVRLLDMGIVLDGASELAFEWTEKTPHGDVLCRGMSDHVWLDIGQILDLKIIDNAAPTNVERSAATLDHAVQHAAYTRALTAIRPDLAGRVRFLFAFCEPNEPHDVNVSEPDGVFRELGEQRWLRAVHAWAKCVAEDKFPGYGVNSINPPIWQLRNEGFTPEEM
jgi:hypothetical protein